MTIASEAVNIDDWSVTIPYTSRALDKDDFAVVLSLSNASYSISPLPLKIEGGGKAKVVVSGAGLSQEIEVSMRRDEHTVNFKNPQSGSLIVLDDEDKPMSTGATVSDGSIVTLTATPPMEALVVDCYKINGKRLFWGKSNAKLEVKEDLNIEVFFT